MDRDIISGWLEKHGKTWNEYVMRLKRDGEVFLGPNGFIEPVDINAVNVEDLEKMSVKDFVKQHKISDDPVTYKFKSEDLAHVFIADRVAPVETYDHEKKIFGKWFRENIGPIEQDIIDALDYSVVEGCYSDQHHRRSRAFGITGPNAGNRFADCVESMKNAGIGGAVAGKKLAAVMLKIGKAYEQSARALQDLGISSQVIYSGPEKEARRLYPAFFEYWDWRWYKPWTWEFFRKLGKGKVMKIKTTFSSAPIPDVYADPDEKIKLPWGDL